jgi:serine/threonine-protein kinase
MSHGNKYRRGISFEKVPSRAGLGDYMAGSFAEWSAPGYTELKPLGSGGYGSVVLARHDATGTPVAIKYLLPKLRQDSDFVTMFRSEAEALGALDDPHVVRL